MPWQKLTLIEALAHAKTRDAERQYKALLSDLDLPSHPGCGYAGMIDFTDGSILCAVSEWMGSDDAYAEPPEYWLWGGAGSIATG